MTNETNQKKQTKKTVTKKEYLQWMYSVLGKKFPLFKTMNTLVEKWNLSDWLVNDLTNLIKNPIKSIENRIKAEKLKASMDKYSQIKNTQSQEDLSYLDKQINNL